MKGSDINILQIDLDKLWECAVENAVKICSRIWKFQESWGEGSSKLFLEVGWSKEIPEASRCKYLVIILRNDLSCVDQFNYTVQKAWKALHFLMRVLIKGNSGVLISP